ncbi:MAG: hypothetical protein BAJALOKI1v1_1530004 [Promethearchaeota archaeon]|nr:MAG: hypothetical protein BAJALOKI1v1_1530004 [Candidatus Lokiarchaeota archaeon]
MPSRKERNHPNGGDFYYCPYCNSAQIVDYGDTFECSSCHHEFEKSDFEDLELEDILSITDIMNIIGAMKKEWGLNHH